MTEKLERFTKPAKRVLALAQEEAIRLNHNYIGTEHLLLGLVREENGVAMRILHEAGAEPGQLIRAIERTVGRGERAPFGKPAIVPRVKQVIKFAVAEAQELGHKHINTGHLLLGLLREGEGIGTKTLRLFVDLDHIRSDVLKVLDQDENKSLARPVNQPSTSLMTAAAVFISSLQESLLDPHQLSRKLMEQIGEEAAQAERDRLARDLHDSIKQQLFSINVSAAAVRERWDKDRAGAHVALDDVQHSAQAAMVEMNALLKQLRPNPLETVGLIDALREQCEALAFRTGAEVTTFFGELPTEAQLPTGAYTTLFRIAQEALSNIARHARAQRIHLRLELDAQLSAFVMEIRDDGQGFDTKNSTGGMGLANMWQRAQSIRSPLVIDTAPGQGTTIRLALPLLERNDE